MSELYVGYEDSRLDMQRMLRDRHMIPIIAMTANAFAEDVQMSMGAGMNGHLTSRFRWTRPWGRLRES
ncbi:MAG: hypothetical protein ACI4AL_10385 [Aristaeellaceae bacterium]